MNEPLVLVGRADGQETTAIITLNRPERANAMTVEMAASLLDTLAKVDSDPSIKGIVLTGAGKHFCPGLDGEQAVLLAQKIATGQHPEEPFEGNLRFLHQATLLLHHSRKPTIAAINGAVAAGGLDLAMACDYRVASDRSTFASSYAKIGLPPLNGSTWLMPRLIGRAQSLRLILSGNRIDAQTAAGYGLVDEICPNGDILSRATVIMREMTATSCDLIGTIKSEIRADGTLADALARAYVAGVSFVRSEAYLTAVSNLPISKKK